MGLPPETSRRRRWSCWIAFAAAVFASLAALVVLPQWLLVWHRTSREYRFELGEAPPALSESLAMEKAKDALGLAGYHPADWAPQEQIFARSARGDPGVFAPDVFLHRGAPGANRGVIYLVKVDALAGGTVVERVVTVELRGKTVVCQIQRPW